VPPVTTPTRNPVWAADELILALDLYLSHRPHLPDAGDPGVIQLSNVLNALPIHTVRPDLERFRNPNGVAMKLANFAALDPVFPGKGLDAGGRGDAAVFDRFRDDYVTLGKLADALRAMAAAGDAPSTPVEDEAEVREGRLIYRLHRDRERNASLANKKKRRALDADGHLRCEVCQFDFASKYGSLGAGYIEAHHVVPLAQGAEDRRTKLSDLALVCANCHRMLHRAQPWISPPELVDRLTTN